MKGWGWGGQLQIWAVGCEMLTGGERLRKLGRKGLEWGGRPEDVGTPEASCEV